ncbi:uncharacterized protein LOC121779014 [Salvia splendens]|uniref:uncharacterized protein LOC121779014 n=1 Tax=Salvia splendens TaxID=180675 RepID=UPI001C25944A|nr:uncharacterized protein LOC121779014 [Salvia splendens]
MIDFSEAIEDCRLLDSGFDGANFTWAKNNLFERLDRSLLNESWSRLFDATRVTNLPRIASDHGPILVRCKLRNCHNGGRAFRFQNMWTRHEGFANLVREDWSQPTGAEGLLNLQLKLSRMKKVLNRWNKETFRNIHTNLRDMEGRIVEAQADFEAMPTPENRTLINKLIAEYILRLKMRKTFGNRKRPSDG